MSEDDEQRLARLRAELADVERRYAEAEGRQGGRSAATARRGPVSLIGVCLGVALLVGVVAAVDLRRLQTPSGTALSWTGAAVFGDCTAYRELSIPEPGDAERSDDERCLELRRQTAPARERAGDVEIELLEVERAADTAAAQVRVTGPSGSRLAPLELRRKGDGWGVVLTDATCAVLACP